MKSKILLAILICLFPIYAFAQTMFKNLPDGSSSLVDTQYTVCDDGSTTKKCTFTSIVVPPTDTGTGTTLTAPREVYFCSGTCTVALPNGPAAGTSYSFCVYNLPGVTTAITISAASNRYYGSPDGSTYGTLTTGTVSCTAGAWNSVCLASVDATHYIVLGYNGTCTAN